MNYKIIIKNVLKVLYFLPIDKNKVYINNFDGNEYGFDGKAFAEYLHSHYKNQYVIYWEVKKGAKTQELPDYIKPIRKNSLKQIFHLITAGILMFNITPHSFISYRKKQIVINTWHGYPFKKIGKYTKGFNKDMYNAANVMISHSKHYTELALKDSLEYSGVILNCGAPRNDLFFSKNKEIISEEVKKNIGVINKKIVLFAPTFRGDFEYEGTDLDVNMILNSLSNKFGGDWVIMYRLHPLLVGKYQFEYVNNIIDVSLYPDMQELLLISDVLITDYSSTIWDFSLERKLVLIYATDLEKYQKNRGLNEPIDKLPFPIALNNNDMAKAISNVEMNEYVSRVEKFLDERGCYDKGKACEYVMNYVKKKQNDRQ